MPVTWLQHVEKWRGCVKCPLGHQRFRICLAKGVVPCDVLVVGEAPGASEDATGEVFSGPAGDKVHQVIDRALGSSVRVAMTNLVCCFPREAKARGDNEPEREEIIACSDRLIEFGNLAQPRLVVCVGNLAETYVSKMYAGPRVHIIHPAYILSEMPQAQKGMALNKCVVQVRSAWEEIVCNESKPMKWVTHASFEKDAGGAAEKFIPF